MSFTRYESADDEVSESAQFEVIDLKFRCRLEFWEVSFRPHTLPQQDPYSLECQTQKALLEAELDLKSSVFGRESR